MTLLILATMVFIIIVFFKLVQGDTREERLYYIEHKIECLEDMCKSMKDGWYLAMELIVELKYEKQDIKNDKKV